MPQTQLELLNPQPELDLDNAEAFAVDPLTVSPWLAASALQKAIRRSDTRLAMRAAQTLLRTDPQRLWRRLCGIAFEDIGLASPRTLSLVMSATETSAARDQHQRDAMLTQSLIRHLCAARKCRAADDLFIAVAAHPELEAARASQAGHELPGHLIAIRERGSLLWASLAVLHASGVRWGGSVAGKKGSSRETFAALRDASIDREVVDLAEKGFRRTREALPLLLSLLQQAFPSGSLTATDDELPPVVIGRNGIPTYCLDAFSWEGKAALSAFLKRDTATGRWLRQNVPSQRRVSVLAGGLFRVEGGLVRQRVEWPCALTLRWLADSGYHGMALTDPAAFLHMIRSDLPKLDEVRHDVR